MGIIKKIDTAITIIGIVTYTFDIMHKTFKWYEKKHGDKKREEISRPIVKGV